MPSRSRHCKHDLAIVLLDRDGGDHNLGSVGLVSTSHNGQRTLRVLKSFSSSQGVSRGQGLPVFLLRHCYQLSGKGISAAFRTAITSPREGSPMHTLSPRSEPLFTRLLQSEKRLKIPTGCSSSPLKLRTTTQYLEAPGSLSRPDAPRCSPFLARLRNSPISRQAAARARGEKLLPSVEGAGTPLALGALEPERRGSGLNPMGPSEEEAAARDNPTDLGLAGGGKAGEGLGPKPEAEASSRGRSSTRRYSEGSEPSTTSVSFCTATSKAKSLSSSASTREARLIHSSR